MNWESDVSDVWKLEASLEVPTEQNCTIGKACFASGCRKIHCRKQAHFSNIPLDVFQVKSVLLYIPKLLEETSPAIPQTRICLFS